MTKNATWKAAGMVLLMGGIFHCCARGAEGGDGTEPYKGDGFTLIGDWKPYDFTTLKVKRTIQISKGDTEVQTDVLAPVLTRRGTFTLDKAQVEELLAIKGEVDKLREENERLRKTAADVKARYELFVKKAVSPVPVAKPDKVENKKLKE